MPYAFQRQYTIKLSVRAMERIVMVSRTSRVFVEFMVRSGVIYTSA